MNLRSASWKWVLKTVTQNFDQKLWMTLGLGSFFALFFTFLAYRLSAILSPQLVYTLTKQAIQKPWLFGFAALSFVIYISTLIYVVRLIIIQIYKWYTEIN